MPDPCPTCGQTPACTHPPGRQENAQDFMDGEFHVVCARCLDCGAAWTDRRLVAT